MVGRVVAAVIVASVLPGCSHVHRVDPVSSRPDAADLNRVAAGRRVSVELVGGSPSRSSGTLRAQDILVAADSTSLTLLLRPTEVRGLWGEPSYGARRDSTLLTAGIRRVSMTNRLRGALDGGALGLGIGVALGTLLGAGLGSTDPWFEPVESSVAGGALFCGGAGAAIGLVTGALLGSRETYEFAEH